MPSILQGTIAMYRLFDVAAEIHLPEVEQLLRSQPAVGRLKLRRQRDAIVFTNPPVTASLATKSVQLCGREWDVQVDARLYDFGAMAMVWTLPVPPGMTLEELADLSVALERPSVHADITRWMTEDADGTLDGLRPAMVSTSRRPMSETLTIYAIESFTQGPIDAAEITSDAALPRLLLGEDGPFSAQLRAELERSSFSYSSTDLTVIGYDQALVYDTNGTHDVASLLEFALVQVLELTFYDTELDKRVREMHGRLEARSAPAWWRRWRTSDIERLRRQLLAQHLDYTEVLERVNAAVKVTPDFYYATIYRDAIRVFRADEVVSAANHKLELISRTYSMLSEELNTHTSHRLEWIIIFLILFEVVLGLWDRFH